jgi:hypothetical protein
VAYQIWIGIEQREGEGEPTPVDPGFASSAEFPTVEEAYDLADRLHAIAAILAAPPTPSRNVGDLFDCARCEKTLHRAESESTTHPGYCVACSDYLRED